MHRFNILLAAAVLTLAGCHADRDNRVIVQGIAQVAQQSVIEPMFESFEIAVLLTAYRQTHGQLPPDSQALHDFAADHDYPFDLNNYRDLTFSADAHGLLNLAYTTPSGACVNATGIEVTLDINDPHAPQKIHGHIESSREPPADEAD